MPFEPGPVDLGIQKPVEPDKNWPARSKPQFLIVTQAQLDMPHQLVELRNNDRVQTHIVIDRFLNGHEFGPGQTKEIDMTVEDINYFRRQRRPNRMSQDGTRLLPTHPVEILGVREAAPERSDEEVIAALESGPKVRQRLTVDG